MIITRTPFHFTLGGGGTDLPSFYRAYGGFVISAAIDKYMFISVNHPIVDDLVRLKYSKSECVESVKALQHDLAKAILDFTGVENAIEIISMADIPAERGLGSSGSYAVGLLHAICSLKRNIPNPLNLSEMACHIEMEVLQKLVGKHDQYAAALGGISILEIECTGKVKVRRAHIPYDVLDELNRNTLIFYAGFNHSNSKTTKELDSLLKAQDKTVLDSLIRVKELSYQIIEAIESGNLERFGVLIDKQWDTQRLLPKSSYEKRINEIYALAKANGAVGGVLSDPSGKGFFIFYTNDHHQELRQTMLAAGLRELRYRFDTEGSKVLVNLFDGRIFEGKRPSI